MMRQFNATRFDFQLHIHTLQPWPAGHRAIAIGWQRGKRRRGATESVVPAPSGERGGATVVRINERIRFKATLYKARPAAGWGAAGRRRKAQQCGQRRGRGRGPAAARHKPRPAAPAPAAAPAAAPQAPGAAERAGQPGPFKRKCLVLAVLETDTRTHASAALGRVVIDLSEFASIDGHELRTFSVACPKAVQAAVGTEPQLTITIRWAEETERERECVRACVRACACMCVRMCACVRACVNARAPRP
jgi:hypothetical protein